MKTGVIITGSGPVLIMTSYNSFTSEHLVEKLRSKGIQKYIAYEVDEDLVKQKYGKHYSVVMGDLKQQDDLRVLDYDGHHVLAQIPFSEMRGPTYHG